MASTLARRSAPAFAPRRSHAGLAKYRKLKDSVARRTASARRAAADRKGTIIAAATAAGVGYAERKGYQMPTIGGVEPTLLYGGVLLALGGTVAKGNSRKALDEVASGMLAVAAYKFGSGKPVLSGDDNDGLEGGGWGEVSGE